MADRIKGITVEIAGDTTKLSSALRDVNKTISDSQKDLKDLNKALKMDPKNVELLRQKQELLNKQFAASEEKLNTLKTAQEQAAKEMANGSEKAKHDYEMLTREISSCEVSMSKLKTEAEKADKALADANKIDFSKMEKGLKNVGDKVERVGKAASVASAAIVGVGVASVEAFKAVDTGADTIIKKTGATGQAAAELTAVYEDLAGSMAVSFDEAGAAVGEINTRWGYTGDQLKDLSSEFLMFSNISGQDVNSAIVGVDKAMKTFNVDSSETKNVLGLLAKTSQNTGIDVSTLEGLLQSSGAALQEMGLGLGESVQLMGALEQSGADASTVISGMKKAAANYAKDGKDMNTELSSLIERLQKADTEAEATEEAFKIFGNKAGLSIISLAKQGKINLGGLSTDFSQFGGVVNDTYQETLDSTDQMAVISNKTKIALGKLGETLGKSLAPILEDVAEVIQKVTDWLNSLSDEEREQIVKIGAIVAAIGPAITLAGKGIKSLTTLFKGLTSPVGLAITAITGFVAGITALTEAYWDNAKAEYGLKGEIKELVEELNGEYDAWNEVKSARDQSFSTITEEYGQTEALWEELKNITDENGHIKKGYEDRASAITGVLADALGVEAHAVGNVIQGYKDLGTAVEETLQKQKLTALLDAEKAAYSEAVLGRDAQIESIEQLNHAWENQRQKLVDATKEYGAWSAEASAAKQGLEDIKNAMDQAQIKLGQYDQTIMAFQIAQKAALSGNAQDWENAAKILVDSATRTTEEYYRLGNQIYAKEVQEGQRYAAHLNGQQYFFNTKLDEEYKKFDHTVQDTIDVIDNSAPKMKEAVGHVVEPIDKMLDDLLLKFSTLGAAMNGGFSSSITVTNNNTLTLDGQVVSRSVNRSLGGLLSR